MGKNTVKIDFESIGLSSILKEIDGLQEKTSEIKLPKTFRNQMESLVKQSKGIEQNIEDFKLGKVDTSDFDNFKKKIETEIQSLKDNFNILKNAIDNIASGKGFNNLNSNIENTKANVKETTKALKDMAEALDSIGKSSNNSSISNKINELEKLIELKRESSKIEDEYNEYNPDVSDNQKSIENILKEIKKEYKSLKTINKELDDSSLSVIEKAKKENERLKSLVKINNLSADYDYALDDVTYTGKMIPFDELIKSEKGLSGLNEQLEKTNIYFDEARKSLESFLKERNKLVSEINANPVTVEETAKKNKNKLASDSASIDETKSGRKQINVPMRISDKAESKLLNEVVAILNSVNSKVNPIEVPISFVSGYKSKKRNELLEQLSEQISNIDEGEIKDKLTETISNIQNKFNDELKVEIKSNVSELENIPDVVRKIKKDLDDVYLSAHWHIKKEDIQQELDNISDLSIEISNVKLNDEALKNTDLSSLNKLKEDLDSLMSDGLLSQLQETMKTLSLGKTTDLKPLTEELVKVTKLLDNIKESIKLITNPNEEKKSEKKVKDLNKLNEEKKENIELEKSVSKSALNASKSLLEEANAVKETTQAFKELNKAKSDNVKNNSKIKSSSVSEVKPNTSISHDNNSVSSSSSENILTAKDVENIEKDKQIVQQMLFVLRDEFEQISKIRTKTTNAISISGANKKNISQFYSDMFYYANYRGTPDKIPNWNNVLGKTLDKKDFDLLTNGYGKFLDSKNIKKVNNEKVILSGTAAQSSIESQADAHRDNAKAIEEEKLSVDLLIGSFKELYETNQKSYKNGESLLVGNFNGKTLSHIGTDFSSIDPEIADETISKFKATVDDVVEFLAHTHPSDIAAFSPGDIHNAFCDLINNQIEDYFVIAKKEISWLDTSALQGLDHEDFLSKFNENKEELTSIAQEETQNWGNFSKYIANLFDGDLYGGLTKVVKESIDSSISNLGEHKIPQNIIDSLYNELNIKVKNYIDSLNSDEFVSASQIMNGLQKIITPDLSKYAASKPPFANGGASRLETTIGTDLYGVLKNIFDTANQQNESVQNAVKQALIKTLNSYGINSEDVYKSMSFDDFAKAIIEGNLQATQSAQKATEVFNQEAEAAKKISQPNKTNIPSNIDNLITNENNDSSLSQTLEEENKKLEQSNSNLEDKKKLLQEIFTLYKQNQALNNKGEAYDNRYYEFLVGQFGLDGRNGILNPDDWDSLDKYTRGVKNSSNTKKWNKKLNNTDSIMMSSLLNKDDVKSQLEEENKVINKNTIALNENAQAIKKVNEEKKRIENNDYTDDDIVFEYLPSKEDIKESVRMLQEANEYLFSDYTDDDIVFEYLPSKEDIAESVRMLQEENKIIEEQQKDYDELKEKIKACFKDSDSAKRTMNGFDGSILASAMYAFEQKYGNGKTLKFDKLVASADIDEKYKTDLAKLYSSIPEVKDRITSKPSVKRNNTTVNELKTVENELKNVEEQAKITDATLKETMDISSDEQTVDEVLKKLEEDLEKVEKQSETTEIVLKEVINTSSDQIADGTSNLSNAAPSENKNPNNEVSNTALSTSEALKAEGKAAAYTGKKINELNEFKKENSKLNKEMASTALATADALKAEGAATKTLKNNDKSSQKKETKKSVNAYLKDIDNNSIWFDKFKDDYNKWINKLKGDISDISLFSDKDANFGTIKKELQNLFENNDLNFSDIINSEELINEFKRIKPVLINEFNKLKDSTKGLLEVDPLTIKKQINKISDMLFNNTAMPIGLKNTLSEVRTELENALDPKGNNLNLSISRFKELAARVLDVEHKASSMGKTGKSGLSKFTEQVSHLNEKWAGQLLSFYDIIRYIRTMYAEVKNIDSALIELKKVTSDLSTERLNKSLKQSFETAKELGSEVTTVINATADWARLGYGIADAEAMARITTLYKNIGDNMDMDKASEYLISTLKGFQLDVEDGMSIIDKFNEVANNYAIDTAGIGEALERSAASFNTANTSLSESIALITATNAVVQNPDTVGTMWKTVAARIRGAKTELEDMGEDTEGMVESTSKLRDLIKGMTGFDIMKDEKTFKSIYDIVVGIGEKWKDLNDIDRAALLEALAGKRAGNSLAAALNNVDELKKVYKTAEESAGSALREQENYQKSIQYSTDLFKAELSQLYSNVMNSDWIKQMVDGFTEALKIVTKITDKVPSIIAVGSMFGISGLLGSNKTVGFANNIQKQFGSFMKDLGNKDIFSAIIDPKGVLNSFKNIFTNSTISTLNETASGIELKATIGNLISNLDVSNITDENVESLSRLRTLIEENDTGSVKLATSFLGLSKEQKKLIFETIAYSDELLKEKILKGELNSSDVTELYNKKLLTKATIEQTIAEIKLRKAQETEEDVVESLTESQEQLEDALDNIKESAIAPIQILGVVAVIAVLTAAIYGISKAIDSNLVSMDKLEKSIENDTKKLDEYKNEISELQSEYNNLEDSINELKETNKDNINDLRIKNLTEEMNTVKELTEAYEKLEEQKTKNILDAKQKEWNEDLSYNNYAKTFQDIGQGKFGQAILDFGGNSLIRGDWGDYEFARYALNFTGNSLGLGWISIFNNLLNPVEEDNKTEILNDEIEKYKKAKSELDDVNKKLISSPDDKQLKKEKDKINSELIDYEEILISNKVELTEIYRDRENELRSHYERMAKLQEGGNVDLFNRPKIDAGIDSDTGEQYYETVYSSTFGNEDGTIYMNFTPIVVDENGNYEGTLSDEDLQTYAENVINGIDSDYLNLKIGATFDSLALAEEAAKEIHTFQEQYYDELKNNPSFEKELINEIDNALNEDFEKSTEIIDNNYLEDAFNKLDKIKHLIDFSNTGYLTGGDDYNPKIMDRLVLPLETVLTLIDDIIIKKKDVKEIFYDLFNLFNNTTFDLFDGNTSWGRVKDNFEDMMESLRRSFETLKPYWESMLKTFEDLYNSDFIQFIINDLIPLLGAISLDVMLMPLISGLQASFQIIASIASVVTGILDAVANGIEFIIDYIDSHPTLARMMLGKTFALDFDVDVDKSSLEKAKEDLEIELNDFIPEKPYEYVPNNNYHSNLSDIDKFNMAINSDDNKALKSLLVGLSKEGKLDKDTLSSYREFNSLLKSLGITVSEDSEDMDKFVELINGIANRESLNSIKAFGDDLNNLKSAYENFASGKRITIEQLEALENSYGNLDSYRAFEEAVMSGEKKLQPYFDNLATEMMTREFALDGITEATKQYYIEELKSIGVTNAQEVAENALAKKEQERIDTMEQITAYNDYYNKSQSESITSTEQLENASYEQLATMEEEAEKAGLASDALAKYALKKALVSGVILDEKTDINEIARLAGVAGVGCEALDRLLEAKQRFDSIVSGQGGIGAAAARGVKTMIEAEMNQIRKDLALEINDELNKDYYSGSTVKWKPDIDTSGSAKEAKETLDKLLKVFQAELDAGKITFQEYVNKSLQAIEEYYKKGKITAQEYYDYLSDLYSNQIGIYDKVISAVQKVYSDEIDKLNKQKEEVQKSYNEQIEVIQKKIDSIQEENDEIDRNMALSKAQYQLARSQNQRTKLMYSESRGFYYEADLSSIKDAQEEVRKAQLDKEIYEYEKQIKSLQDTMEKEVDVIDKEIDRLQKLSDAWGEVSSKLENEINRQYAAQILGANWEKEVLEGRQKLLEDFTKTYEDLQTRQKNAYLDARKAELDGGSGSGSNGNSSNGDYKGTGSYKTVYSYNGKDYETEHDASNAKKVDLLLLQQKYKPMLDNVSAEHKSNLEAEYNKKVEEIKNRKITSKKIAAKFAGTSHATPGETLVGELGSEIILNKNGTATIVDEPTIVDMKGGEKVFNAKETERILKASKKGFSSLKDINPKKFAMLNSFASGTSSAMQNAIATQAVGIASGVRNGLMSMPLATANGQTINNTFNVSLPNINDASKASDLMREFEHLFTKSTQYFN